MIVWQFVSLFFGAIYTIFIIVLFYGWQKIKLSKKNTTVENNPQSTPFFSVIIPIRNEAQNLPALLQVLSQQTLDSTYFEVIIVNDHSTDDSVNIIQQWIRNFPNIYLLQLQNLAQSGKKNAITYGISQAKGKWIVTTDGDCLPTKNWLSSMYNYMLENPQMVCISAPVRMTITPQANFLAIFQAIDFASLIGTGAACIAIAQPTMCNGANFVYQKAVFEAVNGFSGNLHVASGDDEFLLKKIAQQYPQQIGFVKNVASIVSTPTQPSWSAFLQQRKRWASKWILHGWKVKILALFVFLFHFVALFSLFIPFFEPTYLPISGYFWLTKWGLEQLFLGSVLHFLGDKKLQKWIPLASLFYPFYAVFMGIISNIGGYHWKDRNY
jgi:biofilm PGA synthesis N-glycosyltransferase PgaC